MTKEEKKRKEAENQTSAARLLEELEKLPNIDIDPFAMLAERDKNSLGKASAEGSAMKVPACPESKKHHGTLDLPVELYERLRLFAFQQRKSINSIVEVSVRNFLDERDNTSA